MIVRVWRRAVRLLGSPKLALWLLVFIGAWSGVATAVPQGGASTTAVVDWAARHRTFEAVVRVLGLHAAFSSPAFLVAVMLLALSTAVCSWSRTKVAISRVRVLGDATSARRSDIVLDHDVAVACATGIDEAATLRIASETVSRLGLRVRERDGVLRAVSGPWTVWGSAVFHWALFVLAIAAFAGMSLRIEGSIPVPVGQTVSAADPAAYVSYESGPLAGWRRVERSIRVDAFDPDYKVGGIDRGPVPTVSLLDPDGHTLVTQRVYPNMKLHSGSISLNAPGCGLVVDMALIDPAGKEVSRFTQLVRFSQEASGGTVPMNSLVLRDPSGAVTLRAGASVPLDRSGSGYGEWIPQVRRATVKVVDGSGRTMLDAVVPEGGQAAIAGGGAVKVLGLGWYSRLSVVDDPTIPFIYAAMIVAMAGLALSLCARQQMLVATVANGPEGHRLVMRLRLWRNVPATREEIESSLAEALGREDKEIAS